MIITKDDMGSYIDPDMLGDQVVPGGPIISNPIIHSIISNPEEWASMTLPLVRPQRDIKFVIDPLELIKDLEVLKASAQRKSDPLSEYPKTYIPSQNDQYQKFNTVDSMEGSKLESDSPKERVKPKCSAL